MINLVKVIELARTCTPAVARAARNLPKMQKTVTSLAKMAESAEGSKIGELLAALSETGQRIAGHRGIIELEVAQSKNCADATIIRAVFKKGTEVVGKFATWVSPTKQKTGAFVNNSSYRHVAETLTPAERFKALAEKLGVDIKVANQRLNTANGAGVIVKDEQTMTDVILGKYVTKVHKRPGANFSNVVPTEADPIPADSYFLSGYDRFLLDEKELAENIFSNPKWRKLMGMPKIKANNSPLNCKEPLYKIAQ